MHSYQIPVLDSVLTAPKAITPKEKKWIKENLPDIELALVGWLCRVNKADLVTLITENFSQATQATLNRLYKQQLISTATKYAKLRISSGLLSDYTATKENLVGKDKAIKIKLERTNTEWVVYPIFLNEFKKRLLSL